jgi:hypothetical protein
MQPPVTAGRAEENMRADDDFEAYQLMRLADDGCPNFPDDQESRGKQSVLDCPGGLLHDDNARADVDKREGSESRSGGGVPAKAP